MPSSLPLSVMVNSGVVTSLLSRSSNPFEKCLIATKYEVKACIVHVYGLRLYRHIHYTLTDFKTNGTLRIGNLHITHNGYSITKFMHNCPLNGFGLYYVIEIWICKLTNRPICNKSCYVVQILHIPHKRQVVQTSYTVVPQTCRCGHVTFYALHMHAIRA